MTSADTQDVMPPVTPETEKRGVFACSDLLPGQFVTIKNGDCRTVLKELAPESIQCVVTSPPYWGLRDYGHADQIGQEETPDAYVQTMRQVFAEVWRALKDDGTVWLNLGDSYASAWACDRRSIMGNGSLENGKRDNRPNRLVGGLKEKDLVGIPWIGGFSIAAQRAGWKTIAFSEINPYACKILAQNFPGVPNLGDIRNIKGVRANLVTGGFPCQPFSTTGERRGAADDRALWPEMRRVIADAKPAWVLGENVAGFIGMELDNALADLESLGYSTRAFILPACAVDARHRRDRCWILGHADSLDGLPTTTGLPEQRPAPPNADDVWHCWEDESGLDRVVGGVSRRVDRNKALGNAIVPQVAESILRGIARVMENI